MTNVFSNPNERLRAARVGQGYPSARIFCEKNSINYNTYISHENGKNKITNSAAETYSEILGVPAEWIIFGINKTETNENTTNRHLKEKALLPAVMPKGIELLFKILEKHDDEVDYVGIYRIVENLAKEAIKSSDDADKVIQSIAIATAIQKEDLMKKLLKKNDSKADKT